MITPMCAYSWGHDSAHGTGMIAPECAYMHAGMIAPMCEYSWGTIAPMCAYMCRHECAYVARWLVGMKILRADKTRPDVNNLKGLTLCLHIRVQACICDTQASCLAQRLGTKFGCSWQQSGEELRQPCL